MKKTIFRKSMSVFLACLMLLSCWIFVEPEQSIAHAASAFDYDANTIAAFEKYVGAAEGSATIDSQYGKYFPDDSRGAADAASLYKNVAYSSDAYNVAGVANYNLADSGALESFNVYYPLTVLMYDGVTTPQFGISVRKDAKNNCAILHWGTAISGTGLEFVNEFWRGVAGGSANGKFLDSYLSDNIYCGSTIADTSDKQYNYNGEKGDWYWMSNLVKYTGSMDNNTYLTTIYPSFKTHVSQDGNDCDGYKGDAVVDLGTASVPVHVINVKPWNDAVAAAISMYQTLSANENAYTADTITNFKNVAKNLLAANPQHGTLVGNTLQEQIGNIVNAYSSDAKLAVAAWNSFKPVKAYTITWKNYDGTTLETDTRVGEGTTPAYNGATPSRTATAEYTYTFNGWSPAVSTVTGAATYTAQFSQTGNKYNVVFDNMFDFSAFTIGTGALTINERTDTGFTVTSTGSDGNTGFSYAIPVTPGKTYIFSADVSIEQAAGDTSGFDMYINTLDANMAGETSATVDTSNGAHKEGNVYISRTGQKGQQSGATDSYIRFTAGATTAYIKVRFDANTAGNKLTVNNIRVYEEGTIDTGAPYVPSVSVTYDGTYSNLPTPTRDKYEFLGWYKADGTKLNPTDKVDITDTLYVTSKWKQLGHTVTWKNWDGTVLETDTGVAVGTTPTYNGNTPTKPADAQYTYTFTGWSPTVSAVTGDTTYTAQFEGTVNKYKVTWVIGDRTEEGYVDYGTVPTAPTNTTKPADDQYTYTFTGWDKNIVAVTGDVTYTAQYSTTTNTYTVEWVVDNKVVETDTVEYGKVPTYDGAEPTKAPNAQYSYTFDKWSPAIAAVTGHARYEATFTETLNKYTVNWVVDNEIYHTEQVEYGKTPTLPATPTKAADAQYTYTFKEWTPTVTAVMNDTNYTAVFDKTVNKYTVTWVDEDGTTELYSAEFEYGATPVYDAEEPTKAATAQYTYTFAGWDRAYETVKADATYTATYSSTVNKYTIKFVNHDGTELQSSEVEYGTKPVYTGAEPTKAKDAQYTYVFTGWDPEIAEVTEAATYTAQFSETTNVYTVTWVNYDGTELEVDENVPYGTTPTYDGATPTKPQTDKYEYTFADKWSPEVNEVTGDVTYTAQFTETVRKYTITWMVNGIPVKTDEVEYDTVPVYTGATPTKEADAQYTYTFKDWSPAVVAVTGPATYVAEFDETVNTYTVTWVNDDNSVLETDEDVPYGAMPSYDSATPTKAKDAQYTYTFDKWTPEISTVEGNITYKATYTTTTNKYTVTWKNENGAVLETDVGVEYGKMPTFDQANPTKAATAQYSYTFAGWTPEVSTVTGDVTYTAKYDSTVNEYTITWIVEGEKTTTTVKYGETPAYSGTPKKAQTPEFTYEFAGWDPAVVSVTGEATYTATFTPITRSYKVTWVDENGTTELYTETLLVGATIPNKEVPYKDGFIGVWGTYPATMPTNDLTIKAEYFEDGIKVNWVIDDTTTYQTAVRQGYQITPDSAWETKAPTVSTVYTFKGWSETKGGAIVTTFPTVTADDTEDKTYYAVFEKSARKYTITWKNADGTELKSESVAYGETPAYTGATPTKAATAQYTYTHSGWTPAVAAVTGDATYTATYTATVNEYTITWKNADGTELKSESVAYGETPEYTGEDPVKEGDAQYSYVFTGWTPALAEVKEDATYTATFAQVVNEYTVTWVVEGVTVETDENVPYGTVPTFNGSTPTKTADAQYTYTFASWDPTVSAITGDTTYNATFDKTVNKYTVTWANDDGSEIYSEEIEYGKTPEYTGEEPTKAATAQYTYAFDGWDKEITAVEGDVTYTATYSSTVNKYTVTWVVEGETVETDSDVEYGTMASYDGAEPTKAGNAQYSYTFDKWTPEISEVTGDVTYTATFTQSVNKYTITWIVNGVETTEQVEYGTVPTFTGSTDKAPDNTTVYTFAGWDNEVVAVTGNATYTATYSEEDRLYTITWIVDGNTTTEQYKYNEVPTFKGSTDKAPTEGASYEFAGWDKEIANVTADATYTAEYDETVRMFTITWIVDGQEIKQQWAYGTVPAFDGSTDKAPSATATYTFAGWDKTPVEVKSDATYTATYTESVRKYTVVWYVDGEFFATQDVAYNTVIPTPGLPADKEGYTVRWDNSVTIMPAGDVEIHAIYTPRMYPVYWMVDGLTVYSASVAFGNTIPTMTVPAKEGYTGKWVNIPATMPAGIVTIEAEYTARTYSVFWKIGDAQGTGTATYGENYVLTFDVAELPEALRITINNAVISEDSYIYDSIAGTLIIYGPAITGNISIVAKSTSGNVNVTNSIFGGSSSNTNNVIEMRKTYHTTITPAAGYLLPKTVAIYVDGIYVTSGYSYDPVTGKLTINAEVIVGELEIYAECLEDPNYDSSTDNDNNINTDGCSCNCHSKNAFIKFFFDIFNFLRKLFGMEKYHYCECGAAHW